MAVTSLWAVRGNLGGVLDYAANPEKTDLTNLLHYATQQRKTTVQEEGAPVRQLVTGIHCTPATARQEMQAVKSRFGKEAGVIAYHGYQSFAPGECTPELAHEIGVKLARQLWGDRYQVLVATHLDRENHLHSHYVINTVSFVDGKKFYRSGRDYRAMREASDALCREYGLSVLENPQPGKTKHYAEYQAEQNGKPTWRSLIKRDVDAALRQSMTERQFFHALQRMGYEVKVGADFSVRPQGKERVFPPGQEFGGKLHPHRYPQPSAGAKPPGAGIPPPASKSEIPRPDEARPESHRFPSAVLSLLLPVGYIPTEQAPPAPGVCPLRSGRSCCGGNGSPRKSGCCPGTRLTPWSN